MTLDVMDRTGLEQCGFDISAKLASFHENFEPVSSVESSSFIPAVVSDESIAQSFGIEQVSITPEIRKSAVDTVKDMYHGVDVDGRSSLGLEEINGWNINPEYYEQNLNQHAGYAAEVISTAKENFMAEQNGTGVKTYRADDLPESLRSQFDGKIAAKNDQYVDKVRVKADGTYETVQTKFVGNDAKSCLSKLTSKKYEKYLEEGKVDKIEIPKDYYDDVKTQLNEKTESLKDQYDRLCADGKTEEAAKVKKRIDNNEILDGKLEASTVTKADAKFAVEHPKAYAAKQLNNAGLKQGAQTAVLTAAVSGAENFQKYRSGEISGKDAVIDTVKDSAVAGSIAYGTEIVTQLAGGSSVPAAMITMSVESFDDIKDFAEGDIDGGELAYNLGENAARVIGGTVGMLAGGAVGSIATPVGSIVGGMAGSAAGSAVAQKAYQETVEFVKENIDTVIETGSEIIESVVETVSDFADNVSNLFS